MLSEVSGSCCFMNLSFYSFAVDNQGIKEIKINVLGSTTLFLSQMWYNMPKLHHFIINCSVSL